MSRIKETAEPGWKELTQGAAVYTAGNSKEFKTGDWSTRIPVLSEDKCKRCFLCVLVCPDSVISAPEGRIMLDSDHCKGCGICERECRFGAIRLVEKEGC